MGIRDEEYDRTARQEHQAALRAQLLRLTGGNVSESLTTEQLESDIKRFGEAPVKPQKGRHRKPKK